MRGHLIAFLFKECLNILLYGIINASFVAYFPCKGHCKYSNFFLPILLGIQSFPLPFRGLLALMRDFDRDFLLFQKSVVQLLGKIWPINLTNIY